MHAVQHVETVFVFVSTGVETDGGGIAIGPNGQVHHIGPWGPETQQHLIAASAVLTAARTVKDPALSGELQSAGTRLFLTVAPTIREAVAGKIG